MLRCPLDDGGGSESDSRRAQFAKRYEPLLSLVPDCETRASQALKERQPPTARELRMIVKDLRQPIERDTAGKMVHMVHPDITCEPGQRRRQFIVGTSIESCFMKVPLAVMSPKRVLELMLDIKEPDGDRGAHDHHGSLHEKEGADSHKPDKQRDDAGDCRVGPHCAYPGLPARAHHADRKAIMQHEEVSRNQSKHNERVTVGPIDEALKAGLREIFIF